NDSWRLRKSLANANCSHYYSTSGGSRLRVARFARPFAKTNNRWETQYDTERAEGAQHRCSATGRWVVAGRACRPRLTAIGRCGRKFLRLQRGLGDRAEGELGVLSVGDLASQQRGGHL